MNVFVAILRSIIEVFVATAPFFLLGLFLAGWLKIVLRMEGVERFLGGRNLRSALWASLFGLPLPICSCGVVPLSLSLKNKGASREANLSFLISTPESSVDTLAITWGLLGPIMAVVRPIAAFFTAIFAAALSIAVRTDRDAEDAPAEVACTCADGCACAHDDDDDYHVVGLRGLWESFTEALRRRDGSADGAEPASRPVPLRVLNRDAMRYAFVEMFDDLSYWLVLGLIVAGALAALLPSTWIENLPGGQLGGMLFMLVIGVPMYVCAVESTPIAAVLIAKGLSPGAALVFLLAGPATNTATIVLLERSFGRLFTKIYLAAIAIMSIACGLALNWLLAATGWTIVPNLAWAEGFSLFRFVSIACALLLVGLIIASFLRLDWRAKWTTARNTGRRLVALVAFFVPGAAAADDRPRKRRRRS